MRMPIKSLRMKVNDRYVLSYGGLLYHVEATNIQAAIAELRKSVKRFENHKYFRCNLDECAHNECDHACTLKASKVSHE